MSLKPPATLRPGIAGAPKATTCASLISRAQAALMRAMIASEVRSGVVRFSNGSSTTNIEAKFGLLACSTNEMPEIVIVWATPFVFARSPRSCAMALLRPLERSRVGELDVADDPALILRRHESRGRLVKNPTRSSTSRPP